MKNFSHDDLLKKQKEAQDRHRVSKRLLSQEKANESFVHEERKANRIANKAFKANRTLAIIAVVISIISLLISLFS